MVKGVAHKPFFKVNEGKVRCVFVFGVNETRIVLEFLNLLQYVNPFTYPYKSYTFFFYLIFLLLFLWIICTSLTLMLTKFKQYWELKKMTR